MLEILSQHYLFAMGGAVFLLFLLFLMLLCSSLIPHVLIGTYFFLPLLYKVLGIQSLPLTTVFTLLLGPIVLIVSRKRVLLYLWPVACYLLVVLFTSWLNHVPLVENKSALIPVVIASLCMLSFSDEKDTAKRLFGFTRLIVVWVLLNSVFSILQLWKGASYYLISATKVAGKVGDGMQRGYGLIGMATQVGINFCLGVPLCGAFLFERDGQNRVRRYLVFALCSIGLVLSFSRGALLGVFFSFLFLLLLHKRTKTFAAYLVTAATLVLSYGALVGLMPESYGHFFLGKDKSAEGRLPYVQIGLRMFGERPFTGFGYGGFADQCVRYGSPIHLEAHNTYVQVLVEYGLIGLCAFLLMLSLSAFGYLSYIRRGRSALLRTICIGYFAAFVALLVNGLVHCMEWNLVFWLVVTFGFLMRHHFVLESRQEEPAYGPEGAVLEADGELALETVP